MADEPKLNVFQILKRTTLKWVEDEAPMMGAALAYFSLFSIAPMLLVALTVAGLILSEDAVQGELEHHLTGYFGADVARSIQTLLAATQKSRGGGIVAIIVGTVALLFGASTVFNQLKKALNRIWDVEQPQHTGFRGLVLNRLIAMGMVLVVGLLLLSSVFVTTVINRVSHYATEYLPISPQVLQFTDLGVTFLVLSALFAVIFRYMPDVYVRWSSVVTGAVVTAVLFVIGKYLISMFIARAGMGSGYGAASSVLVLLVWIYYSAMIFLFGAEFTAVYSKARHLPVTPVVEKDEVDGI